jgi:predicted transcriptional regulator
MSVLPRFGDALLDGSKTVEIRRRRARFTNGTTLLLYASTPVRALVGAVSVRSTDTARPEDLWARWGPQTALTHPEFHGYLDGMPQACAIVLSGAVAFSTPVELAQLRERYNGFVTPQSYRFVAAEECEALLNGQSAQLQSLAR